MARNTLLRTGVLQILSDVVPNVSLQGFAYSDLDRHPDPAVRYDLLLLSIASRERQTSLVLASLKAFAPQKIVLMAEGPPDRSAIEKLPQQVVGYIDKSAPPEVFIATVRRVLEGKSGFPWPVTIATHDVVSSINAPVREVLRDTPPSQPSSGSLPVSSIFALGVAARSAPDSEADLLGLTPRQYEVLVLLSRGHALKSVSRLLNISLGTTKAHTEAVYQRLGAHNRNEAVYIARAKGARLEWEPEPVNTWAKSIA